MYLVKFRNKIRGYLQKRYDTSGVPELHRYYGEQMAYGHREILLEYMSLPRDLYFKSILTHGKVLPDELDPIRPNFDRLGNQLTQVLWRGDAETEAANKGVSAISIGATGVYAMLNKGYKLENIRENIISFSTKHSWGKSKEEILKKLSGKRILYLPVHSWDGDVVSRKTEDIELLRNLNKNLITVCLGYLDFIDPQCRNLYSAEGFKVECAGIRASKVFGSPAGGREKFLYNLFDLILNSDFVLADEFTTGLLYAICLGKEIGILTLSEKSNLQYSNYRDSKHFEEDIKKQSLFFRWMTGTYVDPKTIEYDVKMALGIDKIRSKEELLGLLPTYKI